MENPLSTVYQVGQARRDLIECHSSIEYELGEKTHERVAMNSGLGAGISHPIQIRGRVVMP